MGTTAVQTPERRNTRAGRDARCGLTGLRDARRATVKVSFACLYPWYGALHAFTFFGALSRRKDFALAGALRKESSLSGKARTSVEKRVHCRQKLPGTLRNTFP